MSLQTSICEMIRSRSARCCGRCSVAQFSGRDHRDAAERRRQFVCGSGRQRRDADDLLVAQVRFSRRRPTPLLGCAARPPSKCRSTRSVRPRPRTSPTCRARAARTCRPSHRATVERQIEPGDQRVARHRRTGDAPCQARRQHRRGRGDRHQIQRHQWIGPPAGEVEQCGQRSHVDAELQRQFERMNGPRAADDAQPAEQGDRSRAHR